MARVLRLWKPLLATLLVVIFLFVFHRNSDHIKKRYQIAVNSASWSKLNSTGWDLIGGTGLSGWPWGLQTMFEDEETQNGGDYTPQTSELAYFQDVGNDSRQGNWRSDKFTHSENASSTIAEKSVLVGVEPGKKKNLLFVKTHKCGTSTVVNVLYLKGIRSRMNFVMRPYTHQLKLRPDNIDTLLPPRPGAQWNIQCQHTKFDSEVEHMVLPKNRTLYTTIARTPIGLFRSFFTFFGAEQRIARSFETELSYEEKVKAFLDKEEEGLKKKINKTSFPLDLGGGLNSLATDLGFSGYYNMKKKENDLLSAAEIISDFLVHLDRELDLVMLTERMDESLVLLAHYLGWELTDVLYLKRMVSKKPKEELTEETEKRIAALQVVDRPIYDLFSRRFEAHIDRFGRDLFQERVAQYRQIRERFDDQCFDKSQEIRSRSPYALPHPLSDFAKENTSCGFLQMRDVSISRMISDTQLTNDYTQESEHMIPTKLEKSRPSWKELILKLQSDFDHGINIGPSE